MVAAIVGAFLADRTGCSRPAALEPVGMVILCKVVSTKPHFRYVIRVFGAKCSDGLASCSAAPWLEKEKTCALPTVVAALYHFK